MWSGRDWEPPSMIRLRSPRVLIALRISLILMASGIILRALIFILSSTTVVAVQGPEEHVVPTTFCGNYIVLEFEFASSPDRHLRMLLDTGASISFVDPDSIERISGKRVKVGKRAKLSDLSAGPLKFNKLSAKVMELDHIAQAFGDKHLDGILGFPAFKQLLLTIDYPNREIRIAKGSLPKADGTEVFKYTGKRRPSLATRVNGRKVKLLLDSGSNDSIAIHEKHELDWAEAPIYLASAVRLDRIEQRFVGRLASDVVLGSITFEQPIVEQTDRTELVGTEILKNFVLTFDQRNRRVRMIPVAGSRVRVDGVRSTGVVPTLHPRGKRVIHIVPQSPAEEAGIEIGDVITTISGLDVHSDGCARRNLMMTKPEAVSYVFERDGERHEVVVPIAELIP